MARRKKKINLRDWATRLTEREGGKVSLSVAQVAEVLRLVREDLREMAVEDLDEVASGSIRMTLRSMSVPELLAFLK